MASDPLLDFDRLFAPISDEAPAGENLREDASPDSPYLTLKDARRDASAAERALAIWDPDDPMAGERPVADWSPIIDLAPTLLMERTKDLELGAWLIEALVREHGAAGLRDGIELCRGLCEHFWDSMYPPLADEMDATRRVAALAGLNGVDRPGTLIQPLRTTALTDEIDEQAYGLNDYSQSEEAFANALSRSDPASVRTRLADYRAAREALTGLAQILTVKCSAESRPPLSAIQREIEEAIRVLETAVGDEAEDAGVGETDGATEAAGSEGGGGGGGGGGAGAAVGAIRNREDAFRELTKIADFFTRTEPHSPISMTLRRVVDWGRMDLKTLWADLISDESERERVFRLVGIPIDRDEEE